MVVSSRLVLAVCCVTWRLGGQRVGGVVDASWWWCGGGGGEKGWW